MNFGLRIRLLSRKFLSDWFCSKARDIRSLLVVTLQLRLAYFRATILYLFEIGKNFQQSHDHLQPAFGALPKNCSITVRFVLSNSEGNSAHWLPLRLLRELTKEYGAAVPKIAEKLHKGQS